MVAIDSSSSHPHNSNQIFPLTSSSSTSMQVQNLGPVIPVRLTETNYLLWKSVFLPVLHKYKLLSIIDGSELCPPEKVKAANGDLVLNDAFVSWFERDQQLLIRINSTLSESVFPYVIGHTHARDLWLALEARFAGISQAHLLQLKGRLQSVKKGSLSMTAYLQLIKGYADNLAALGAPVSDNDLVAYCIQGLSDEYSAFATALRTRMGVFPVTSTELHNLLLSEEIFIEDRKQQSLELSAPATAFVAAPSNSHGGSRGSSAQFRGRGRSSYFRGGPSRGGSFAPTPTRPRVQCQICERQGHTAIDCYNRMNHAYVGRIPPAKLSAMFAAPVNNSQAPVAFNVHPSTPSSSSTTQAFSQTPSLHPPYSPTSPGINCYSTPVANSTWLADSSASQHVTPDLSHLSEASPYYGNSTLTVGNGHHLPIAHVGSATMHTPDVVFKLKNVLHVPEITQNLLSVNQFVTDNNCAFVLTPSGSMIKALGLRRTLSQGPVRDGVYPITFSSSSTNSATCHPSPQAHSTSLLSGVNWHARLGHANNNIVNKVLRLIKAPAYAPKQLCSHCMQGKAHRLPFNLSSSSSTSPLELLHADVWGPVSTPSRLGYSYFLSIVDDWSKFSWIIPLFHKSDVPTAFHLFKLRIENLLSTSIKVLRSDNGGEFTSARFKLYLANNGITQQFSCAYTPQQNGTVERKHRHLIEIARTILIQSRLPLSYWLDACHTAIFVINRLPTMHSISPYEKLFHKAPDYYFLKPFGCLCFPWLKPYTKNKFEARSSPCIFIGYSHDHKGYNCLDPSTGKIYTSRHVQFDETNFPYQVITSTSTPPPQFPVFRDPYTPPTPASTSPLSPTISSNSTPATLPSSTVTPPSNPSNTATHTFSRDAHIPSQPPPSNTIIPNHPPPSKPKRTRPPPLPSSHDMLTRSKTGHSKPKALLATKHPLPAATTPFVSLPPTPTTYTQASKSPEWVNAMNEELSALQKTNTWTLVPYQPHMNVVGYKWVFRIKHNPDGSIDRFKARLIAKGYHQQQGIDFDETFSPVAKPTTIRLLFTFAVQFDWPIFQIDVNNAFLHGHLKEEVYMEQPPGLKNPSTIPMVCKLQKSLYGLKQAPRAWYDELYNSLLDFGFLPSPNDTSLFFYTSESHIAFMLVYVDDILITASSSSLCHSIIQKIKSRFPADIAQIRR